MSIVMPYKFKAFLTYSHKDSDVAQWLFKSIESYWVHRSLVVTGGAQDKASRLAKGGYLLRPMFRDREELAAAHSLSQRILEALGSSEWLVVVCSPDAAHSRYVNQEILQFKALGGADRILPIIVAGEPGDPALECFPPALLRHVDAAGELTDEIAEPIAADARAVGDGREIALQKLIAGMLGVGLDAIVQRAAIARRRRMVVLGATATAMSSLAIAAGIASVVAVQQRDLAVRRLTDTETVLDRMMGTIDLSAKLHANAGILTEAIVPLLEQQEKVFLGLSEEMQANAAHRYRWSRFDAVLGDGYQIANNVPKALVYYARVRERLAGLVTSDPNNRNWRMALASALERLGYLEAARQKPAEALALQKEGRQLRANLRAIEPDDKKLQAELARSHRAVGDLLLKSVRDRPGAIEAFQNSLELMLPLVATDPSNSEWNEGLAESYGALGRVQIEELNSAKALTYFQQALDKFRVVAADPKDRKRQWRLAQALKEIGELRRDVAKNAEAIVDLQESQRIVEGLIRVDPENTNWLREKADIHEQLSIVYSRQAEREQALRELEARRDIFEKLAQLSPTRANRTNLARSLRSIGDMQVRLRRYADAQKSLSEACTILERVSTENNSDARDDRQQRMEMAWVEHYLGMAATGGNRLADAVAHHDASRLIWQEFHERSPEVPGFKFNLADATLHKGRVQCDMAAFDEGIATMEAAHALRLELAADNRNLGNQNQLAWSYEAVGTCLGQSARSLQCRMVRNTTQGNGMLLAYPLQRVEELRQRLNPQGAISRSCHLRRDARYERAEAALVSAKRIWADSFARDAANRTVRLGYTLTVSQHGCLMAERGRVESARAALMTAIEWMERLVSEVPDFKPWRDRLDELKGKKARLTSSPDGPC